MTSKCRKYMNSSANTGTFLTWHHLRNNLSIYSDYFENNVSTATYNKYSQKSHSRVQLSTISGQRKMHSYHDNDLDAFWCMIQYAAYYMHQAEL